LILLSMFAVRVIFHLNISFMKEKWNQRYAAKDFVYGTEPNLFFKELIDKTKPGKLLLPAEGEGRNAVYAASMGWEVHAFDYSTVAVNKGLDFAKSKGVTINYFSGDFENFNTTEKFDLIALLYTHMEPRLKKLFLGNLHNFLKPEGKIIAEFFSKEQIHNNTGGPQDIDLLYSLDEVKTLFSFMKQDLAVQETIWLEEGLLHVGKSDVIRLIMSNT